MAVYENVVSLCKKRGITVAQLERECHLGNGSIRWWRTGDPRYSTLKTVATFFGVTVMELAEGNEDHG